MRIRHSRRLEKNSICRKKVLNTYECLNIDKLILLMYYSIHYYMKDFNVYIFAYVCINLDIRILNLFKTMLFIFEDINIIFTCYTMYKLIKDLSCI